MKYCILYYYNLITNAFYIVIHYLLIDKSALMGANRMAHVQTIDGLISNESNLSSL